MKKIIIAGLAIIVWLYGAEYGRITGKVIDTETNEPLVGADIVVEGTELGAATDEDGEYTVLYVPVGVHRVVASYISYDHLTYTNVIVNADQTTALNFRLRPTIIEVAGVVTEAERPMVVISETGTGRAVTSNEMARLPVTTINQVINLQAGVVQSDLGTHIRGGRSNEITYFVDGIVTKVPQTGLQTTQINPAAVEEVTVVSGGFDAEYGDALSGIVNIVTKEGGTKLSGSINFLTDEIFSTENLNYGYNKYGFALGGPMPMSPRFRYFISGELMMTDAFQQAVYKIASPRMDYRLQGRLTYQLPNAKGKIMLSGFRSREQYVWWWPYLTGPITLKYFDNKPMDRRKNWIASATFNYMPSAKTLVSLKVGTTHYERMYGNRDYAWEQSHDRAWYDDYRMKAEHLLPLFLDEDYQEEHGITIQDLLIDSVMQYHTQYENSNVNALRGSPYGVEGLFYTYGDFRVWRFWYNNDYQGRFDITHAVGRVHEFKTGVDLTQYDMKFFDNNLPWVTNPFWDAYHRTPYKLAGYLQDKMDFEGIIARLGMRFDYFDAETFSFTAPNDFQDTSLTYAGAIFRFSPRIGFSLPVTERMKLRFNYGHYSQLPGLNDIYTSTDTSVVRVLVTRGNAIVGNILLKPQKTVQYEFGIENQFTEDVAFGFTAYFKDIYDLSQVREVVALPLSYYQYFNVDYGNVKGFEFTLTKRMTNMWSVGLTYTLQFARGTASSAVEWYNDHYQYNIDPPVIDYWLDFDERNIVNANIDFEFPRDFFFIPLQDFTSSFVFSYHSGHPYTPENLRGERIGDENSARIPGYWNVDLNASRVIMIGPAGLRFNILVQNLFNTTQVTGVYLTTGDPEKHGDPEPAPSQFGNIAISSLRYSPQADYDHDGLMSSVERTQEYILARDDYYRDPTNYNGPFRIQIGVGLNF